MCGCDERSVVEQCPSNRTNYPLDGTKVAGFNSLGIAEGLKHHHNKAEESSGHTNTQNRRSSSRATTIEAIPIPQIVALDTTLPRSSPGPCLGGVPVPILAAAEYH